MWARKIILTYISYPLLVAALVLLSVSSLIVTRPYKASAAIQCTPTIIDWQTLGWDETNATSVEVNTYFDEITHNKNPYHGLGSAAGGVSGFLSQSFTDVDGNGTDLDIYYSHNMHDQVPLDSPNLYGSTAGANPDRRVTGQYALRYTRDITANYTHGTHGSIRSPATMVMNFSKPFYMNEIILASLSQIGSDHENTVFRAFDGPNATGSVVKASEYNNISDLDDDSSLLHGLGDNTGPVQTNDLSNVNTDPDNTFDVNGDGTNIGSSADDGIYHTIGAGNQGDGRYGRVLLKYENTPIRSIAVSTWMTAGATDFSSDIYTGTNHSAIFAPFAFCEADHDYGDAPDAAGGNTTGNYNTVGTDNGASHAIDSNIHIGSVVDADDSLLQNASASDDDNDGVDDEDGVIDLTQLSITDGQSGPQVDVVVYNMMGEPATLYGWIDYDGDGLFDNAAERASVGVPNSTNGTVTLTFPDVPTDASSLSGGSTYMRLRLSTDSDPSSDATGAVSNGEVEDYVMSVLSATTTTPTPPESPAEESDTDMLEPTGTSVYTSMLSGAAILTISILLSISSKTRYRAKR